jgi:hypothetical protein
MAIASPRSIRLAAGQFKDMGSSYSCARTVVGWDAQVLVEESSAGGHRSVQAEVPLIALRSDPPRGRQTDAERVQTALGRCKTMKKEPARVMMQRGLLWGLFCSSALAENA